MPSRAGEPGQVSFKIKRYDGTTVRDYKVEQTRKLHLYVVRTDLAVFRHLHTVPVTVTVHSGARGS